SGKFSSRAQHPVNSVRPPRRFPLDADGVWISVRGNAPVRRRDDSRWRIEHARQSVERDIRGPLVRIIATINRKTAITSGTNRNFACRLISDVPIYVGIHHVLPRRIEFRKRPPKFLPVLRRICMEEWAAYVVVKRPPQRKLSGLAGNKLRHDRPMPCHLHIQMNVGLAFHVNDFTPYFW